MLQEIMPISFFCLFYSTISKYLYDVTQTYNLYRDIVIYVKHIYTTHELFQMFPFTDTQVILPKSHILPHSECNYSINVKRQL